jgi:hypothetical protein
MYIRHTSTRSTATGENYLTHRLVESQRAGSRVRQVTLLNHGRHFEVDQEQSVGWVDKPSIRGKPLGFRSRSNPAYALIGQKTQM